MNTTDKIIILIIGVNASDIIHLKLFLKNSDLESADVMVSSKCEDTEAIISNNKISIILLDLNLPGSKGLETFSRLGQIAPGIPVVVLSEHENRQVAIESMKRGAQDYLVKGEFNATLLAKSIQYAIERSRYSLNLLQKDEEYKYLFDNNPNPLLIWDKQSLKIIRVNHAAINYYECSEKVFYTKFILDIFDPEELKINEFLLHLEIRTGNRIFSSRHLRASKYSCYVDLVMKDIEIAGNASRIMLVNDVTEKHIAMERLIQSEQQLRKLADNYPNGTISIIDRDFILNFADGKDLALHGLVPENILGVKYTDFLDEKSKDKFIGYMNSVFGGDQAVFDIQFNGDLYLVSAAGLVNSKGIIDRVILVSQNITGNILAKKEIIFQAEILNNVDEAVVVKDLEGRIIYCNSGSAKLFGYSVEQMTGNMLNDFISDGVPVNNFDIIFEKVMAHGTYNFESEVTISDRSRLNIETKQTLMCNDEGKPAYIVGISHDITSRIKAEQVLKESEANLQAIFQSTSQVFLLMDIDTRIIAFNRNASIAVSTFYNKTLKKGDNYRSLILPGRKAILEKHITEVLNWKIVKFEEKFDFPGRKEVHLEITYSPVIKNDEVIAIIMCAEDITEKVTAKDTILKSEQKYRELVETAIDIIWTVDENGTLVFVNEAVKAILGWDPSELIGKHFIDFVADEDKERVLKHMQEALLTTKHHSNYESCIIRKNASAVNVITHAVVNVDPKTQKRWLTGTSRDITQRVIAEKELSEKNNQLRMLSSYLQTIREDERTHIAREIHDELGQQLTALKMDLACLNRKLGTDNTDHKNKLQEMMKLVDDTVKSVRKISSDLRPGILDDLGLIPAIEWQCLEFEKRNHIPCRFVTQVPDVSIDKDVATGVFRILQESLTNIARHAGATKVKVEFLRNENEFELVIKDNGKGFLQDTNNIMQKTFGLVGMRERAVMLNGHFKIRSQPEKGTKVILTFPNNIVESIEK